MSLGDCKVLSLSPGLEQRVTWHFSGREPRCLLWRAQGSSREGQVDSLRDTAQPSQLPVPRPKGGGKVTTIGCPGYKPIPRPKTGISTWTMERAVASALGDIRDSLPARLEKAQPRAEMGWGGVCLLLDPN